MNARLPSAVIDLPCSADSGQRVSQKNGIGITLAFEYPVKGNGGTP
ncbi:MAG: hypothetical protein ACI9ND_002552 [Yoonia sp.]|jgi:hypothetical protein